MKSALKRRLRLFRISRKLQLFNLALVGFFVLAEPIQAKILDFSGKKTGNFGLVYTDYSMANRAARHSTGTIYTDIAIVNQGAYTINDLRVTQNCVGILGLSSGHKLITTKVVSDKRGVTGMIVS